MRVPPCLLGVGQMREIRGTFVSATVRVRKEPGFAFYVERGDRMLHVALRRFDPPYGDGRSWTRVFRRRGGGS